MSLADDKYKGLGVSFDGNSTPIKGIESAIFRLSEDVAEEFRKYFKDNNLNASSALSNSIGGLPVTISDNGAEINIVAEDYFKFLDEGVDGLENKHGSQFSFKTNGGIPFKSASDWIKARGITLLPNFKSYDQMAYAFAVSIKKKGIKPRNILKGIEVDSSLEERMAKSLEAALGYSVELTLTKIVNDVNK